MNPDGHGGSLRALAASGAIADMRARGIEHISYIGVDNPLVKVIDPMFLGLHVDAPDSSAEISSKMVAKTSPDEKVGVFCRSGGKTIICEYIHLPADLAAQRDADDRLRFGAGRIAGPIISGNPGGGPPGVRGRAVRLSALRSTLTMSRDANPRSSMRK